MGGLRPQTGKEALSADGTAAFQLPSRPSPLLAYILADDDRLAEPLQNAYPSESSYFFGLSSDHTLTSAPQP